MKLLIASKNRGKLREIKSISKGKFEIISPLDLPLNISILEDGFSLEENALKKALTYHRETGFCTLGEDTALEVEILRGRPGIHSARFSGGGDRENRKKLLEELNKTNNRSARFRTVMALVLQNNWVEYFEGLLDGKISLFEKGDRGFGYDPIFIPLGYDKTLAEISEEEKNRISHRGKALNKLIDFLQNKIELLEDICK
jgi:XTP/dITP diphosphohydrolase